MPYVIGTIIIIGICVAAFFFFRNRKKQYEYVKQNEGKIREQIIAYRSALSALKQKYVSHTIELRFADEWQATANELSKLAIPKKHPLLTEVNGFLSEYKGLHEAVNKSNEAFIIEEKTRCDALLSNIDGKSLDDQQRTVVVSDEDHSLVLAGAGSGKTLTIAGKVKYLCDVKHVDPKDILLIAFTKKSSEEMSERIGNRLGLTLAATTFHKLGLDIITAATSRRPEVIDNLDVFVRDFFENDLIKQPQIVRMLIEYFAYYLNIPADMNECSSIGEAYEKEKSADFETVKSKYDSKRFISKESGKSKATKKTFLGEHVKSIEEVTIANFLFLNGVKYEYERLYPFESDDPQRKAYRPDFYLPDYDLYIEHFGVSKDFRVPWLSAVEEQKYLDGIKWKRDFHKQSGTKLLETYSYYSSEGRLLEMLEKTLRENGVAFRQPDFTDIFNTIYSKEADKYFAELIKLCCTFITLFKSNGYAPDQLWQLSFKSKKYDNGFFRRRTQLFKSIVHPILVAYAEYLESNNAIDFSDMINNAAATVSGGYETHKYKYVIIDEYQDISVARYKLVKAILDQTAAKLLCVGDDWQSIYRFAGSDISLFTDFEQYFGYTRIMRLEKTYRNSQQLIDEVGRFITKNPKQLRKSLRSDKSLEYPIVFWCYDDNPFAALKKAIDKIIADNGVEKSILLLGRTTYDFEIIRESRLFNIRKTRTGETISYIDAPDVPIEFLTVHKSKGLEADNVVLLNFQNSKLGFPNKIADDPVLELVLSSSDQYEYAEERRLLYVAITRTKNRTYIITDNNKPSEFISDFKESKSVFYASKGARLDRGGIPCPRCKTGRLLIRKNEGTNKFFVGCTNYPQCEYTVNDTSIMNGGRRCPRCGGFLVKRKGRWGLFWGCTNYPQCEYTEQIEKTK